MATISFETFFLHLIDRVEKLQVQVNKNRSIREEIRTLEFWRSIIAECLASFFYVFLLCGAHVSWPNHDPSNLMIKALTSGLTMATLAQCFNHISGAHVNPAVTFTMFVTRRISPLRASLYVIAQCGGSIAGAALLYGVTIPGHQGTLGNTLIHPDLGPWQAFGVEFVLTFLVVFTVFATQDPNRRSLGSDALTVGIGYLATSLPGVYWFGPLAGAVVGGLIYEYIFDTKKAIKTLREAIDEVDKESNLDEDDYENPERCNVTKDGGPQTSGTYGAQYYDQTIRPALNTYSPTHSTYPVFTESSYGTHSGPSSNYSGIYGSRGGGGFRTVPARMEYDPGTTKF
ncbi:neurogenic protein big brain-like isoform X2 [Limulus polyphemus]|uniref:Neurogenic protein big brain-like isoform X2 n=1 Tax=Limulus polyphemus TaxID=6850 RepID=A0ABM1SB19_LIMPO|nr:neurogenic protein big brain-like isoform X2 [Limulus polyphemus]